jgi:hypothetical protein
MAPIELKIVLKSLGGRDLADFGTVRPRVQIPGPRLFRTRVSLFELWPWERKSTFACLLRPQQTSQGRGDHAPRVAKYQRPPSGSRAEYSRCP